MGIALINLFMPVGTLGTANAFDHPDTIALVDALHPDIYTVVAQGPAFLTTALPPANRSTVSAAPGNFAVTAASARIQIYRGGSLVRECNTLPKKDFTGLDNVVIRMPLDTNGVLTIGGKIRGHFINHPNAIAELHMTDGFITEVRLPNGKETLRCEFVLIYRDGKLFDSCISQITKIKLSRIGTVTIRKRFSKDGQMRIAGSSLMFEKFPNHPVDIDVKNGVITEIRILKNVLRLIDTAEELEEGRFEMALVYKPDEVGKMQLSSSYYGALIKRNLAHLNGATIRRRFNGGGHFKIGGRVWATIQQYVGYPAEADIRNGVVTRIRVFKNIKKMIDADEIVEDVELALIYQNSLLVDSFYEGIGEKRFEAFEKATIQTRLDRLGRLCIGGEPKAAFSKYPDHPIQIDVQNGVVLEVRILKPTKNLAEATELVNGGKRGFSLIFNEKGQLVDSYNEALSEIQFSALKNHTIVTRLDKQGNLTIGGRLRASFSKRNSFAIFANRPVVVRAQNGIILGIDILKPFVPFGPDTLKQPDPFEKKTSFQLVWDAQGKCIDSFYAFTFIPPRFRNHVGRITGDFKVDRYNGFLHGRKSYFFGDDVDWRGHSIKEILFGDVNAPGEITEFVIEDPKTQRVTRVDARKVLQHFEPEELIVEIIPSSEKEQGSAYRLGPMIRIGPKIRNPEEELIRTETVAIVRRALESFSEEEQDILLGIAVAYHDSEIPKEPRPGIQLGASWLIETFLEEWKLLDQIAAEFGVSRGWIIESFRRIRKDIYIRV
ncbi:MAG: hypothetical protein Q7T03_07675 [Deltaproteobacteria bacterium]|nr:hypothetical protein [Deltaproteobacteria bacterium]